MSATQSTVAIVGSGIVGTTIAYLLTQRGYDVTIFEQGPAYPYPHSTQFNDEYLYLRADPAYTLPPDIKNHTSEGIPFDVERERFMRVGGSATAWEGICIRMHPNDFRTRSRYGYGEDWPISYDDLEPYYVRAEQLLGVSGTDDDNPFAGPRSAPLPLPPFALAYDDVILAERLRENDILLHTTPQARTRQAYDGRPQCANFTTCRFCPIGARYSPGHHLQMAINTGLCQVITDASVRRIVLDQDGQRARSLIYQLNDGGDNQHEHACDVLIVAAGAIASSRLLLLSHDSLNPDGIGNAGGLVGRGLAFHYVWTGRMRYAEALYPGRLGGWTGQSQQFIDAETRGQHGSLKVEFSSRVAYEPTLTWAALDNLSQAMEEQRRWRPIVLQAESPFNAEHYVTLSQNADRFGDPFPHIHYYMDDFAAATYDFARGVFDRFVSATRPEKSEMPPADWFDSGSHHMGGCRMGDTAADSVVNTFGQVHNIDNLYVVGGSNFVGSSGAVNPTLTMVALAVRAADYLMDQSL